ncbi:density-regulated protein homolog [Liolophura sinensis]|uniref:density-regulated protein homolog n=1 Tax=Liolophura sinensis TaxID=3198878 RepID=UPI003158A239
MAEVDASPKNADSAGDSGKSFFDRPKAQKDVRYPIMVTYCGECSLPIEYCEYHPNYERCKKWLEDHLPEEFEKLMEKKEDGGGGEEDDDKKSRRQKRGGKGMIKTKKKAEPQGVKLALSKRGKKKMVTIVMGLGTYEIDLKDASKFFSSKFSCGSSVTGDDEIVIQGDVKEDLLDILSEKWPEIDEDDIDDLGEMKK